MTSVGAPVRLRARDVKKMSASEFRLRLAVLGLSIREFAMLVGVNTSTASYWGRMRPGSGFQTFPAWVDLLLTSWEHIAVYVAYSQGGV